jgi:hypothetical protein
MLASNVNVKRAGKVSVARDGQMDGIAWVNELFKNILEIFFKCTMHIS